MSLPNGHGTPVIRIFNFEGTEVFERVTTFSYLHSEKLEDASRIVIETDDITIVDHPGLQEGKVLKAVFGILGGVFRSHLIWIWDVSPTFNENGVRLEIVGYCKAAYMKLNSSKDVFNESSLEDIASDMAEAYGLNLKKENIDEGVPAEDVFVSSATIGGPTIPVTNLDTGQTTVARDKTSFVMQPYVLKKHDSIPQANRSDAKLLEQTAAIEPVDGMTIEGRDDNLIIKRRNLYQKPFKAYKYKGEPGYLLDFTPASKNSSKRKEATANSVAGWDEEDGEYFQSQISHSSSGAGLLGDLAQVTVEEKILQDMQKGLENPFDQPKTVDGLVKQVFAGTDEEGKPFYKQEVVQKLDSTSQFFVRITKKGTRASVTDLNTGQVSAAMDVTGRIETTQLVPLNPKEYLPLLAENAKDAAGQGVNRQSAKELELEECNATILGDPELRSGRIISVLGVGQKYTGNYYIISCEHEFTPQNGYRCRCVIARNAKNKIGLGGDEDFNTVPSTTIDATKNVQVGLPSDGSTELFEVPLKSDT